MSGGPVQGSTTATGINGLFLAGLTGVSRSGW